MHPEEPRPRGLVPGGRDVWSSRAPMVTKKNHEEQSGRESQRESTAWAKAWQGDGRSACRQPGEMAEGRAGGPGSRPREATSQDTWQSLAQALSAFGALHRPLR